ncbi:hypothetical protein PVK06_039551 [Gossypium arboreum]|uniref:Uncharacterized protein n=1 Tax=Gossypium arboreum TaxID=29729 RepID=A0ABR0N5B1_GOSAR|nr:hypothetical protein PVK06_039551 [Gossypium arboreum]
MVQTQNQSDDNFLVSLNGNRHRFLAPPVVEIADDKPPLPPPRRMAPPARTHHQRSPTLVEPEHLDSSSAISKRSTPNPQSTLPLLTYHIGNSDGDRTSSDHVDPSANERVAQRQTRSRGHANTIPTEGRFRGFLYFSTLEHRTRYDDIRQRPLQVCKQIDSTTLNMLDIQDAVTTYFDAIGWSSFVNIACDAYYKLIYEFYTKFSFNTAALQTIETKNIIYSRLLGKDFRMSIFDFNVAMGFVDPDNIQSDSFHTALLDILNDFNAQDDYRVLTNSNQLYNPETTKYLLVHEPALRYIHRFLAFSFSG